MFIRKHSPTELQTVNRLATLRKQTYSTFVLQGNRPEDRKVDAQLKKVFNNLNKGSK